MANPRVIYFYDPDVGNFHYGNFIDKTFPYFILEFIGYFIGRPEKQHIVVIAC
jgi:hypothetical protein